MKSLQLRLGVGLFISLISAFILLWWLTSSSIRYLAEESVAEQQTKSRYYDLQWPKTCRQPWRG
jgi:hypothetical protein